MYSGIKSINQIFSKAREQICASVALQEKLLNYISSTVLYFDIPYKYFKIKYSVNRLGWLQLAYFLWTVYMFFLSILRLWSFQIIITIPYKSIWWYLSLTFFAVKYAAVFAICLQFTETRMCLQYRCSLGKKHMCSWIHTKTLVEKTF